MGRTIEDARQVLQQGPQTALTREVMRLLSEPDLVVLDPGAGVNTAANHLRTYKGRLDLLPITGLKQLGLAELVSSLAALPPTLVLTVSAFETKDQLALLWTDPSNQLVGTLLIERQDDTARREWFKANLI